jgi:pantoate--beta-alanine ligase
MAQAVSSLRLVNTIAGLRELRAHAREPVGFVPTMGALHAGHASLVERARADCATVIASIFVNPLQFGPREDYERYPRTIERDLGSLEQAGADIAFVPGVDEIFPSAAQFSLDPGPLARYFEGERRPGHFAGVAAVVLKLFNIAGPHRAYFGNKDAQQLAVVKRLVDDFNLPIEVVACDTIREPDGLAMSSRNAYLSADERTAALRLYRALSRIAERIAAGDEKAGSIIAEGEAMLPPLRLDYLAVVDPAKFEPLSDIPSSGPLLAIGAAFAGETRLIDNVCARST